MVLFLAGDTYEGSNLLFGANENRRYIEKWIGSVH